MNVLGIETSCDETASSVVRDGRNVLSNTISSSASLHNKYGGVIPEIASRSHLELIDYVVEDSLRQAGLKLKEIGLISVTENPGLPGSLLVGVSFAKALAFSLNKPLIEVDHLKAHLYSSFLDTRPPSLPAIGLVVSGGHTSLFYIDKKFNCKLLGSTLDDAAGEAYDKVAKILGLGYPGGPIIDRLAKKGDPEKIKFSCDGRSGSLDFSFSGIKTAVLYYVRKQKKLSKNLVCDIAASFQDAVVGSIVKKSMLACRTKKINTLIVGGGVISNSSLRDKLLQCSHLEGVKVYFPPVNLCVDNAAMVAGMGYYMYRLSVK